MIAAISIPDPVKENTAPSGVGLAATGGTLLTRLCRSGTGKFQVATGLTMPLNQFVPQSSRITHTMIHGISANHTSRELGSGRLTGGFCSMVAAESSWLRSAGESHSSFGCHTCRNRIKHAIEINDAPMSTIHGLMKFEIRNCGTANETPHTRIAGQMSSIPRRPANVQISQNGTMSEKNGNCRPTMAPSR